LMSKSSIRLKDFFHALERSGIIHVDNESSAIKIINKESLDNLVEYLRICFQRNEIWFLVTDEEHQILKNIMKGIHDSHFFKAEPYKDLANNLLGYEILEGDFFRFLDEQTGNSPMVRRVVLELSRKNILKKEHTAAHGNHYKIDLRVCMLV